jgi:hypothetical protein
LPANEELGSQAELLIVMSATGNSVLPSPSIKYLKKWLNVIIRMKNTILDVYTNGVITKRFVFKDVARCNPLVTFKFARIRGLMVVFLTYATMTTH